MECLINKNKNFCNCSYSCSKHGLCCQCIKYHRERNELPACYFNEKDEKTYDRSVSFFIRQKKG